MSRSTRAGGPAAARWSVTVLAVLAVLAVALSAGCTAADGNTDDPAEPDGTPSAGGRTIEVTIPADGIELVGTLRLPDTEGPAPVVMVVHGSGPQSRDGLVTGQLGFILSRPVLIYRELAEGLVERGYAVFTWDKRTCGPFNGCAENGYLTPRHDLAFETLRADAVAALDMLTARDDTGDVVLVGHSKGGTIATGIAAERDDLAGLVLLASPAVPVTDVLHAQADKFAALVVAGAQQGDAADRAVAELRDLAAQVTEIANGQLDGPAVGGVSREFWASYLDASLAAPQRVAATTVPVLALGGAYDWNVPPDQVLAWERHLGEHGRVEILPHITHALTYLGTDDVNAISSDDVGERVDPSVVEALVSWLDEVLNR